MRTWRPATPRARTTTSLPEDAPTVTAPPLTRCNSVPPVLLRTSRFNMDVSKRFERHESTLITEREQDPTAKEDIFRSLSQSPGTTHIRAKPSHGTCCRTLL